MRCYDGFPDSRLQALIDYNSSKTMELKAAHKDARCTYFPMEERYQVFVGTKQFGDFSMSRTEAIDSAIRQIKETHEIR